MRQVSKQSKITRWHWLLGPCLLLAITPLWASTSTVKPAPIPTDIQINWNNQPKAIESNLEDAVQGMIEDFTSKHTMPSLPILIYQTKETMKGAVAPYGYFSPRIRIQEQTTGKAYRLTATINLRKPIIIRHITWHMKMTKPADPMMDQLATAFPLKVGDILNTNTYDDFKKTLLTTSSERGYFDAHLTKSLITVNRKAHWADLDITFAPSNRYRFNTIKLQNSYLSQKFLNRFVHIKQGEWFNSDKLNLLQQHLQNTHYFSLVDVTTHLHHKTNLVDVDIHLKLGDRYHYTAGIGYGTDTKARATLGMSVTPFNKRGHSVDVSTKLGIDHTIINAAYSIPGHDPVNTEYNIFTRLYQMSVKAIGSSTATTYGLTATHVFYPTNWLMGTQAVSLYQLNERSSIVNGPLSGPINNIAMIVGSLSYTFTPPPLNKAQLKHSFLASFTLTGSHKGVRSPISFVQFITNLQYLQKLGKNWRVILSNQWGVTHSNTLNLVPFSLQLLTGGSDSIRGYEYNSIGPGSKLFVGNIELQREIKPKWYLGVFYDAASVSNHWFKPLIPGLGPNILQSVGPSLTRSTPIGSIAISAAKPLFDPHHKGWSVQLNWGQTL
jgi:translocation and assembly module TamA